MKLIQFPEQNAIYGNDQKEYEPLPAYRYKDSEGRIVCCWQLTPEEIEKVKETGVIWHQVLTFNQMLQPQLLTVDKPDDMK